MSLALMGFRTPQGIPLSQTLTVLITRQFPRDVPQKQSENRS